MGIFGKIDNFIGNMAKGNFEKVKRGDEYKVPDNNKWGRYVGEKVDEFKEGASELALELIERANYRNKDEVKIGINHIGTNKNYMLYYSEIDGEDLIPIMTGMFPLDKIREDYHDKLIDIKDLVIADMIGNHAIIKGDVKYFIDIYDDDKSRTRFKGKRYRVSDVENFDLDTKNQYMNKEEISIKLDKIDNTKKYMLYLLKNGENFQRSGGYHSLEGIRKNILDIDEFENIVISEYETKDHFIIKGEVKFFIESNSDGKSMHLFKGKRYRISDIENFSIDKEEK